MKKFLRRLYKFVAYSAATVVILLAIAVGLFRLFLPRLPEYQDDIKEWASSAIGMQVEFSGMDARWGLTGPELKFYEAELIRPSNQARVVAAREVGVGVSLVRLMIDRTLVVDDITVRETSVEIRELEDGTWSVQGNPIGDMLAGHSTSSDNIGSITVIGEDIEVQLIRPGDERPTFFEVSSVEVKRDSARIALDANVRLPEQLGRQMNVSATRIIAVQDEEWPWDITVEADDLNLAGLSDIQTDGSRRFGSGGGDLDLSLAVAGRRIISATADIDFEDVSLGDGPPFDINGRFELNNHLKGWLFAADELRMTTPAGEWPQTSLRLESHIAKRNGDDKIVRVDARASYLNLSDFELFLPWLDTTRREQLQQYLPDGVVRDLDATVSALDTDDPRYSVSVALDNFGFSAVDDQPGFRGFTGDLKADHNGGQLDIRAVDLFLTVPAWLSQPVDFNAAEGTIIWRRSNEHLTILSHSISLRNDVLDSQSNVEITIDGDDAPVIDLASNWTIEDLAAANRYLPEKIMAPKLYAWFHSSVLSGRMTAGTARMYGPLDRFPFDGGEGRLLIEASIRDMDFRYNPNFPISEVSDLDVIVDNVRLYTESNRSVSSGNTTVDAKVEIADLRDPVLTIESFTTGTLDGLRDFAANSPIARVFGGQLDRVSVDGDASVALDLTFPIRDKLAYQFNAQVLSENGSLVVDGFDPPITDLNGTVTIERDFVSSESLQGRFLGEPISIELRNAGLDEPRFRVVASGTGVASAEGLVDELGLPLAGKLDGQTNYRADILFPRADEETRAPLTIRVESDLQGLAIDMPLPFTKLAEIARPINGELLFVPDGERIESSGSADGVVWRLDFAKIDDAWDFDRGILMLGDEPLPDPDVRGLHIRGQADEVRFEDWLALSRKGESSVGIGDRIRSIDLAIGDLFLLGQRLREHRIQVDRSAHDWLVQLEGEQVSGSAFVPYDFAADRELVLDMERLILPGDDSEEALAADPNAFVDPRTLPSISVKAVEFAIGERHFGTLEAQFERTPIGLQSDSIITKDATFEVVGNGSWSFDEGDPSGRKAT